MAKFSRLDVWNEIVRIGLVPVFYHSDFETARNIVLACHKGGARVIEFTNRGDQAYLVFTQLVKYFDKEQPDLILGAGSVMEPAIAALYIASGANFIVGSLFNPEVAKTCNRLKISYSPGCGSATEISQAEEAGVEIVKVFPGDSVGGPCFIKSILGPTPWTRCMVTGGVQASQESIGQWFKAGVTAVGMGTQLIRKEWVDAGDFDAISDLTHQIIAWIHPMKSNSLYSGIEHTGLYPPGSVNSRGIANWYAEKFGFSIQEGNSSILVRTPEYGFLEIMKDNPQEYCHVAVYTPDFDAALRDLDERHVGYSEPVIKPDVKIAYLKEPDPQGNLVHLVWRKS
jgi:2-dehydro-3-deoxyphosphogluconate aldolase/(4S)-4-hydroxy-2-oxoglutarate aldolase